MKQRIDFLRLSVLSVVLVAVCTPARSGEEGPPVEAVSYESFAFAPAPGPGPEVTLSDPKAGPWTRVIFAPRALSGFPEELRFLRDLPAPVAGIAGLALSADAVWAAGRTEKRIVRMDRRSGAVTASMAAPGPEPGALHWDGAELWHADGSGRIFALREDGAPRLEIALGFKPGALGLRPALWGPRVELLGAAPRDLLLDAAGDPADDHGGDRRRHGAGAIDGLVAEPLVPRHAAGRDHHRRAGPLHALHGPDRWHPLHLRLALLEARGSAGTRPRGGWLGCPQRFEGHQPAALTNWSGAPGNRTSPGRRSYSGFRSR